MTFKITVYYGTDTGEQRPQVHAGLDPFRAEVGAGAFLRDLIGLEGEGVRKFIIEAEVPSATSA